MDASKLMLDQGGFRVSYRNMLGGNRTRFFKVSDHNEARNETLNMYGGEIDDSPVRIERIAMFGEHTHTWTSDNIWDSSLRLQWVIDANDFIQTDYERKERARYNRYSRRAGHSNRMGHRG